jgi:ATP-dependent helicase/DNAse subunit B
MPLSLVVGPAHAGKVSLLFDRYVEALPRDPWLVVPNRIDVESVERDLLQRRPALLGGRIGTFDDLFTYVASGDPSRSPIATDAQRLLAVHRAIAKIPLGGLANSARSRGFADSLLAALAEVDAALLDPEELAGDLGDLAQAYRDELQGIGLWDRGRLRRRAAELLESDLGAWHEQPVFAYGFEDLTRAEWALLSALAGRTEVTVSIPYEPGRTAFACLGATVDDLSRVAAGDVVELAPGAWSFLPPPLAHLERSLFTDSPPPGPPPDGSLRLLEGAGSRGTVELVADELLSLLRAGTTPESVGVVCESIERWRPLFEVVFPTLGLPFAIEKRQALGETPLGRALLALLRYEWLGGDRGDLFAFLRSPFSGVARRSVEFVEGRLRGRAIAERTRVEEESERLRGAPLPALLGLRASRDPVCAVRGLLRSMVQCAWGLHSPPTTDDARVDARAYQAADRTLDELATFAALGASSPSQEEVLAALERTLVQPSTPAADRGRVAVLDYPRARTRSFEVVFLLGLEEGSMPRRPKPSPFLDDGAHPDFEARLASPDPVARDRYLFYTACTRARRRLVLVRQAVSDEGVPREPSPFWEEVRSLFPADDMARRSRRRSLSALVWQLDSAPSERERVRALARLSVEDSEGAAELAAANGWSRRLERARSAFDRSTSLASPAVLQWLSARTVFSATELERFADCSSAWLVERVIDPKTIDAAPDPLLRGQVAHTTLNRFYAALPRELGVESVTAENLDPALDLLRRCLDDALESGVRLDLTGLQRAELRETLLGDLEGFLRDEAASPLPFVPRKLEVLFGSERAAPELQRGLPLGEGLVLSGKIDRIDLDPFSARGLVQDYKSGKGAHSARDIDRDLRLQIPLYLLVLRDLVGVEPLGGLYRALSGKRVTRGMLRESAREDLPGFARDDYLAEDTFWAQIEKAREVAATNAGRIRAGDVQHDPRWDGACPSWCDLWPICRVKRP